MERAEVLSRLRQTDVQLARFLFCDNGGVIRGKAVHVDDLEHRLSAGVGMPAAVQALNSLDQPQGVDGMGPVGEVRLVPDPDTFVVLPYAPRAGALLTDMHTVEGQPWESCPRGFLKRTVRRAMSHGSRSEPRSSPSGRLRSGQKTATSRSTKLSAIAPPAC